MIAKCPQCGAERRYFVKIDGERQQITWEGLKRLRFAPEEIETRTDHDKTCSMYRDTT